MGFLYFFRHLGYGDSSDVEPSEDGLVNDAIFMYKWLSNRTSSKIFVWGHSLGTGISTHALSLLKKEGVSPLGLVLECPFTNMMEEVGEHPLAKVGCFIYILELLIRDSFLR